MEKLFNTDNLFFMSSSGHCGLTCPYCLIKPVAKNEPSLNRDDFQFLFENFRNQKNGFIFSGKGDFFASYQKGDQLFRYILEHDVEVMLDINGQFLQECRDLPREYFEKIKEINITMHYHQLKEKSILNDWVKNVKFLYEANPDIIKINTIMSPPLVHLWDEALLFYEEHVYSDTGIELLLISDVHMTSAGTFPEENNAQLKVLLQRFPFSYVLGEPEVMNPDFAEQLIPGKAMKCPAGQKYFRVWNDGTVQGCMPNEKLSFLGNLKNREISINKKPTVCSNTHHCDCGWALLYSNLVQPGWLDKLQSKVKNMKK